jgi:hypothetical protein
MTERLQRILNGARELSRAISVTDIKIIRDQAKAIAEYFKEQNTCITAGLDARELQLRAERKLGEVIPQEFKNGGKRGNQHRKVAHSHGARLAEAGISRTQSSRWQAVAQAPEVEFENYVTQSREKLKDPTTSGLIRRCRQKDVSARLAAPFLARPSHPQPSRHHPWGET